MTKKETLKLTTSQALIRFLSVQYVERDHQINRFFEGCFGIFGHGNVAGIGQALVEYPEFPFIPFRNEQGMVHAAAAFARMSCRMKTYACTSSIGPGATNMISGAALATINRWPVLLLPGDTIATGGAGTLLQQRKDPMDGTLSVNDSFKAVSQYWTRIHRPEQLIDGLMDAMKILTSPSLTGAATICLPQDVQAEAYDYPLDFLRKRIWNIPRNFPDKNQINKTIKWIAESAEPLIIVGGGVKYSQAEKELIGFIDKFSIPVCETCAGRGAVVANHPLQLGAIGVTGTVPANHLAEKADLIIAIGTRLSDFTTASNSLFQNEKVKFIFININEIDSKIYPGIALNGDVRSTLDEIIKSSNSSVRSKYVSEIEKLQSKWQSIKHHHIKNQKKELTQIGLISTLNNFVKAEDTVINASGSMPGELNQIWDAKSTHNLYLEYGYSCMGHEIPAGIGAKMANPDAMVYVLIGDGSYLMLPSEIVTAVQLNLHLCIILMDNQGYGSIGQLSQMVGGKGLGTSHTDSKSTYPIKIDYRQNAESLGAITYDIGSYEAFEATLEKVKMTPAVHFLYCPVPYSQIIPNGAWWDVPIAEVGKSEESAINRKVYDTMKAKQKRFL